MSGREFVDYIMSIGFFKTHGMSNGNICEYLSDHSMDKIPTHFYPLVHEVLDIRLSQQNIKSDIYVDFTFGSHNLYASHRLSDLNLSQLIIELNKFLSLNETFKRWITRETRNYKIDQLNK